MKLLIASGTRVFFRQIENLLAVTEHALNNMEYKIQDVCHI